LKLTPRVWYRTGDSGESHSKIIIFAKKVFFNKNIKTDKFLKNSPVLCYTEESDSPVVCYTREADSPGVCYTGESDSPGVCYNRGVNCYTGESIWPL